MKKRIFIILLFIVCAVSIPIAYAKMGGSGSSYSPHTPKPPQGNGLPAAFEMSDLCDYGSEEPIGILVTLAEYDAESKTETESPRKVFFYSGNIGWVNKEFNATSWTSHADAEFHHNPVAICTKPEDAEGNYTCGHTHYVEGYMVLIWRLEYKDPVFSQTLRNAVFVPSPIPLDYNNLPYIFEHNNGMLKLLMRLNNAEFQAVSSSLTDNTVLNSINSLFNVSYTIENMSRYYIKVEPVFRQYQAPAKCPNPGSSLDMEYNFDAAGGMDVDSIPPGEDLGYGTTYGDPLTENVTYYEYEYDSNYDDDEDGCKEAHGSGGLNSNGKCRYTVAKQGVCEFYKQIRYRRFHITGLQSSVKTAREGRMFTNLLYNETSRNTYPAQKVGGNGIVDGEYDYYIGANYTNAMVASDKSYNKNRLNSIYKFANSSSDEVEPRKTIGMVIYYLDDAIDIEETCEDKCAYISDKSSDEYLKCSQSVCDGEISFSGNNYATTDKRTCMIQCGYVPPEPINCSNSSSVVNNGFLNFEPGVKDGQDITGSYCGYESKTSSVKTVVSASKTGGYSICERLGNSDMELNVNGVNVYRYGTNNVQNTYINVACKETTSAGFKDISGEKLKRGGGFSYEVNLNGLRDCIVFFDYEQWKFDFAATHSLDTVRKTLLLNKLKAYNDLVEANSDHIMLNGANMDTEFLRSTAIDEDEDYNTIYTTVANTIITAEGDNLYTIYNLKYNTSNDKSSVSSQVSEYVNGNKTLEGNKNYNNDNADRFNLDKVSAETNKSDALLTGAGIDTLHLYNDYNDDFSILASSGLEGSRIANRYSYLGTYKSEYQIPFVCISDDNLRKITLSTSGNCNSSKFGTTPASRKYFISLNANYSEDLTDGNNHNIETNIKVHKTNFDGSTDKTYSYLKGADTCPYIVDKSDYEISCEIVFNKKADSTDPSNKSDQVCYDSDELYMTSEDTMESRIIITNNTSNNINIDSYTMVAKDSSGSTISSVSNNSILNVAASSLKMTTHDGYVTTDNMVYVYGTIVGKDVNTGETKKYYCNNHINLIKKSDGCSVTKDATNKRYEIIPKSGSTGTVRFTTSNTTDMNDNLILRKIEANDEGKYYVTFSDSTTNEVFIGTVGSAYCQYIPEYCPPDGGNCFTACAPDNYSETCVTRYCNTYGDTDGYNYYPTCKQDCRDITKEETHPCDYYITDERLKEDYDYVSSWCNDQNNLSKTSHGSPAACILTCYKLNGKSKYRPINLNNPFPSSDFSTVNGYQGGQREVGKEWQVNYDSLVEDRDDISKGRKVEYLIELSPSTLKAINEDTKLMNETLEGSSIYTSTSNSINEYKNGKYSTCTVNETSRKYTGYCSSFIHRSNFTSIFQIVDGVQYNGEIG